MTDTEIKKALKTLLELVLLEGCLQRAKTISLALDLINRQEKKIKWLNTDYEKLHLKFEDIENELKYQRRIYKTATEEKQNLKAEVERLKAEIKFSDYLEYETTNQIKVEAYKEFAERLKEYATQGFWEENAYVGTDQIDNLLNKLVGDTLDS